MAPSHQLSTLTSIHDLIFIIFASNIKFTNLAVKLTLHDFRSAQIPSSLTQLQLHLPQFPREPLHLLFEMSKPGSKLFSLWFIEALSWASLASAVDISLVSCASKQAIFSFWVWLSRKSSSSRPTSPLYCLISAMATRTTSSSLVFSMSWR